MATFRIKRYNPEKQPEPYFEDFQLDIAEGATLLDCINQIKWTLDGTLTTACPAVAPFAVPAA